MNKQEVSEIKKLLKAEQGCISKIAGCYVDNEKSIKTTFERKFQLLSEEEIFKYYALLKKSLTGKIGKNLINVPFPIVEERQGGKQEKLMRLLKSKLSSKNIVKEFYDEIIETYDYEDNYFIVLVFGEYDVPGKSSDGFMMDDASEDVYSFIMCLLCPVKPSEPGLSYDKTENIIGNALQNMMVKDPMQGFLFPAFNERNTDIHEMLYYSKKPEQIKENFMTNMFGAEPPATAETQNEIFTQTIESSIKDISFETMKAICENIQEKEYDQNSSSDVVVMDKMETCKILEQSGVDQNEVEAFGEMYESILKDKGEVLLNNIFNGSDTIKMTSGRIKITLPTEDGHYIEIKEVDGVKSVVINLPGSLQVNGVTVNN